MLKSQKVKILIVVLALPAVRYVVRKKSRDKELV